MVLILIFSICPYALSRSEDSSFGIPSCLSSSAFAISLASSALDGAADIFQMQHEESACVLRSMPRNPLHPYFSINHRIFFGSERNSRLPQKDSKYSFLPKVAVFKGFRGHPMFALMPCFKWTLTLLLVLIIRIILSTYKFFPSSYAFFIIST